LEAQTDIQDYLERGKQALAQGQARDAAIAFAHAAQIEPNNPMVHLGLAEANLALGSYGVVYLACRKVQELQPAGGVESKLAQSLLDLLDRRYDRALQDIDAVVNEDPSNAYAHALRAYLLRLNGQDYDAGLEQARAARLSHGGRFENCFPPVEPLSTPGYGPMAPPSSDSNIGNDAPTFVSNRPQVEQEPVPTWSRPNGLQRQMVRTRFALSQRPRLVTNILIGLNVLVFVISLLVPSVFAFGEQDNSLVLQGQIWRIFTAMFLHTGILHIGVNMLSLFFIGGVVEVMYGKWRYLLIYFLSGIIGGITFLLIWRFFPSLEPVGMAVGASGAIFGVFGALGVFYIANRQALGAYGWGAIGNWLFWILLNLILGFSVPGIAIWDHIGGLIAGMLIGFLIMPRLGRRRV
jgi:membrane associated rhomboid family serine protease